MNHNQKWYLSTIYHLETRHRTIATDYRTDLNLKDGKPYTFQLNKELDQDKPTSQVATCNTRGVILKYNCMTPFKQTKEEGIATSNGQELVPSYKLFFLISLQSESVQRYEKLRN